MSDSPKPFKKTSPAGTSQGKPAPATPLTPRRRGIIVGASDGIGAVLAQKLAKEGYSLALIARRKDKLITLCNEINRPLNETRAQAYVHDVANYAEVPALLRRIVADLGGLDLIVFMAGVNYPPGLNNFNFEGDRKMVEVNLIGAMAWLSPVAEMFQNAKAGQIVGISSVAGDRGRIANPGYNTSKGGLTTYLEALRNRLTRHGVNVLTVKPGFVKTTATLKNVKKLLFAVEPETAADLIWDGMKKRKHTIYVAGIWKWIMLVIRHVPSVIFRRTSF